MSKERSIGLERGNEGWSESAGLMGGEGTHHVAPSDHADGALVAVQYKQALRARHAAGMPPWEALTPYRSCGSPCASDRSLGAEHLVHLLVPVQGLRR